MALPKKRHLCNVLTVSETMFGPFPHHHCPPHSPVFFFFCVKIKSVRESIFWPFSVFFNGVKSRFTHNFLNFFTHSFSFSRKLFCSRALFFDFCIHFFHGWIFPFHGHFFDFSRKDFFHAEKKTLSIPPSCGSSLNLLHCF